MTRHRFHSACFVLSTILVFGSWHPAEAKYVGGQPPKPGCSCACSCAAPAVGERSNTSSSVSRTEGNLTETVPITFLRSAFGRTVDLSFTYNSYDADGSQANVDTVAGYGWTHSYNIFLFSQLGAMFRYDGEGRITRYAVAPGGFAPSTGYFEIFTKTGSSSFTITKKDQTVYTFASVPGTPFVLGGPVYRLMQIQDRNGNTTSLTYTGGNLTKITDTYGRTLTFTYNAADKISSVKDPIGRVTTFTYDSTNHKLTRITDPNGSTIQYAYNTLYQLSGKTDKSGRTFTYHYNASFEPTAVEDSSNTTPATLSNPNNWATDPTQLAQHQMRVYLPSTTTTTDGRGNSWQYQYDPNGYLLEQIAPDGATTRYTYDPTTLQLSSLTDPNGHTTSYLYNAEGDLTQATDPLGHITKYTYDPTFNMVTSITDPLGRITTYSYDAHGNRISETDPVGNSNRWTYDSHGNMLTATDKNGNVNQYQYDSAGDLIQETDAFGTPVSSTTQSSYDAEGNRVSLTDPLGRITQYQYDGMNRLTQETDAAGTPQQRTIRTLYDGEGNVTERIDGRGIETQYQYDQRQRMIRETDAVGTPQQRNTTVTYDGDDNRLTITDPLGRITKYEYDTRNRAIQETDASGTAVQAITQTAYDAVGNVTSTIDADGHTTTTTYDALNRRSTVTDALGEETLYFYDGGGFSGSVTLGGETVTCNQCGATPGSNMVTERVDPDGTASLHAGTTYTYYDALGRVVISDRKTGCAAGPSGTGCPDSIHPSSDAVTLTTYDNVGNRLTRTEPDGNTTTDQYDARNRRIQDTNAAGDITITTYDGDSNVTSVTEPNGNVTTNSYDALNRVVRTADSIGLVETAAYDADGNRISHGDGDGHLTTYSYDSLNRMVTATDPLGKTTTVQYDAVGNELSATDRNGNTTSNTYDALNRRSTMTDALGNITKWQYDPAGNLTSMTDANLHVTTYSYDAVNRPSCETFADGTKRCLTYDEAGNLIERADAIAHQTVTYSYNDLYFLTGRAYTPSGAEDTFTYDLSGRMLTNQRQNGTFTWPESFTYDGANRLLSSTQDSRTVTYSYDIPGRMRTVTYPGGYSITEHTDARTRMDHIDDAGSPPPIAQYAYDLANNMTGRNYRNGTTAIYTYNANNWTTSIAHQNPSTFAGFNYAYDNEGNKQYELKSPNPSQSECYGYDAAYRLTGYQSGTAGSPNPCPVVPPPTATTQTGYVLDPVGNWTSKTTNGTPQTRTHNAVNEITTLGGTPLTYDLDGDLTGDGTYTYQYDEEHRLAGVTQILPAVQAGQYQYDALSRRVEKIANPTGGSPAVTLYFYDQARILEEEDPTFTTLATYVYGNYIDEVLTMTRGVSTYYYHQNALWSVLAVTDSAGNPVERYDYCGGDTLQCGDPYGTVSVTDGAFNPIPANSWGAPHSAIGNPWLFTGRQFDEETGLYYYRARQYDSGKGRFLQRDPLQYRDGPNMYEYVQDNPVNLRDPLGLTAYYDEAYLLNSFIRGLLLKAWVQARATCTSSDGCHCDTSLIPTDCRSYRTLFYDAGCSNAVKNIILVNKPGCPCNKMECHQITFDWFISIGVTAGGWGLIEAERFSGTATSLAECADGTTPGQRIVAQMFHPM